MEKTPVLCVVGPTASGKSALAVQLAQALNGEIINMDSMQVYRRMDIGTAKPTLLQRGNVPHHLIDIVEPTESFSVAQYATLAESCIHEIFSRGRFPILVGGTGFYLKALTDGLNLGGVPSDPELRSQLKATAMDEVGRQALHQKLAQVDPAAAAKLHYNDVQRVSRAFEVYTLTGRRLSEQRTETVERPFSVCILGTTLEREKLYRHVEERVDDMLAHGLLGEVEALLSCGVPPEAQAMQGIGYKELVPVVNAGMSLAGAVSLLKRNTRRYAKRQWTWFNASADVLWLDMDDAASQAHALDAAGDFWRETQA
jgi:tRNA dimethylallyltransferase